MKMVIPPLIEVQFEEIDDDEIPPLIEDSDDEDDDLECESNVTSLHFRADGLRYEYTLGQMNTLFDQPYAGPQTETVFSYPATITEGRNLAVADTGSTGTLLKLDNLGNPDITNVRQCYGVGVRGINKDADLIPVKYTARHKILGNVFLGEFAQQLIGIPNLLANGFTIDGARNHLHIRKDGEIIYTANRITNLYEIDINKPVNELRGKRPVLIQSRPMTSSNQPIESYAAHESDIGEDSSLYSYESQHESESQRSSTSTGSHSGRRTRPRSGTNNVN